MRADAITLHLQDSCMRSELVPVTAALSNSRQSRARLIVSQRKDRSHNSVYIYRAEDIRARRKRKVEKREKIDARVEREKAKKQGKREEMHI